MALNVLVVDDSAIMRSMIIKVLRMTGVDLGELYEAANGREGLDLLVGNRVDLVMLDINMPVMNGEEMIEEMRASAETAGLPVVVISTEGSQTRIGRLEQENVWFIQKPFAAEHVREVIREITGASHEQRV